MKKKKRNYNPNKVKSKYSYTVNEIAEIYQLHTRTVQNWLKEGLKPIEGSKNPYLIMGREIRAFLKNRKSRKKIRLLLGEFNCAKCKKSRKSFPEKLKIVFTDRNLGKSSKQVLIKGSCEVCNTSLTIFSSDRQRDKITFFEQMIEEHNKGLNETTYCSLNTDIGKEIECVER